MKWQEDWMRKNSMISAGKFAKMKLYLYLPKIGFDGRWAGGVGVCGCRAELAAVGPVLVLCQQLFLLQREEAVLQRVVRDEGEVQQACACAPFFNLFILSCWQLQLASHTFLPKTLTPSLNFDGGLRVVVKLNFNLIRTIFKNLFTCFLKQMWSLKWDFTNI